MRTRLLRPAVLSVLLVFPEAASAQSEEAALGPSRDNTLYESDTGALSNGAGFHLFAGRTNQAAGSIRRALLAFDVAADVPEGATIDSVRLTLHMSRDMPGAETVQLHRVLADWGESTSAASGEEGGGVAPATGDATWVHTFFDTETWENPGGDFAEEASADQLVEGTGSYTWGSTPEMVADVQQWLDTPETNFGWILLGNESTSRTAKRFDSREHEDESVRPVLQVFYSMTSTGREEEGIPAAYVLAQNYPNPFNPSTTIAYELGAPGAVRLEVYDLLGRTVAVLVDGWQARGPHQAVFEPGALPGGVYVYRLSAGGFSQSRTLVLLK